MNYIVMDMEWNQPYSKSKKYPGGVELRGEIIQIGAVKLNRRLKIVDSFDEAVRPIFYKRINRHVKEITGITDDAVRECDRFPAVFERFKKFCGKDFCIVTWGTDDMPMLIDNLLAHGIDPDTLPKHYNLQMIFNLQITHESRQWSLDDAIDYLGIAKNERPHNALFDAESTARIAAAIDFKKGIENYDAFGSVNGVKTTVFDGFSSMRAAMNDKRVNFTACPVCKNVLSPASVTGSKYKKSTVCRCREHGEFIYHVSVYKKDDCYAAKRKVTLLTKNS